MKTLKLEVGKTYRNRKGEEVKIVRKDNRGWDYWRGSNGEWYYEGGKWSYVAAGHPEDLIEEVPSEPTRHTFDIPDGVKKVTVEQVGNRIVVEMVPEKEPKPEMLKEGDVVFEDGRIMIVKMHPNLYHAMFYGKLFINGQYGIPFTSAAFRPATPEEAQPLWDALEKAGKRWNPETMQVEEITEKEQIDKFLKAYADGVIWSREQLRWLIENYLKHREGE